MRKLQLNAFTLQLNPSSKHPCRGEECSALVPRSTILNFPQLDLGALKGGWGKKSLSVCVCESVESLTRTDLAHRSLASGPSGPRLARSALDLFYIRFYNLATQAIGAVTKSELIKLRFLKGFLIRAARPYNYSVATKSLPYGTTHDWRSKTPIQYMT